MIRWCDPYDTGIEAVDIEHRKFVELIEAMHISIRDNGFTGEFVSPK